MALVLTDVGKEILAKRLRGHDAILNPEETKFRVYLYTNDYTPTEDSLVSDFTAATNISDMQLVGYNGTATSSNYFEIIPDYWINSLSSNVYTSDLWSDIRATFSGNETVYGYYVVGNAGQAAATGENTVQATADSAGSLGGKYFQIYAPMGGSEGEQVGFYVWINVGGGSADPGGDGTGIEVSISSNDTAETVATAIETAMGATEYSWFFSVSRSTDTVTVSFNRPGPQSFEDVDTGFTFAETSTGARFIAGGMHEKTEITVVGDTAGSLDGTYFSCDFIYHFLEGTTGSYLSAYKKWSGYFYLDVDGAGNDPAPGGYDFGFGIQISTGDSAETVRNAIRDFLRNNWGAYILAYDGDSTDKLIVEQMAPGAISAMANGTSSPGFSYTRLRSSTNDAQVLWAEKWNSSVSKANAETLDFEVKWTLDS